MNSQIRKGRSSFWEWLISHVGLMSAVAVAVSLVALCFAIVNHFRPPTPTGVLECMTAGLPDLTVVCSVEGFNFSNGTVDFGDRRPKKEFQNVEASEDPNDAVSFFWRYREPGSYRVNMVVKGESGSDNVAQTVEVSRSDKLKNSISVEKLSITGRLVSEIVRKKKVFSVSRRLSRGFFRESRSRYRIRFEPETGWSFAVDGCKFQRINSQFYEYQRISTQKDRGIFEFVLENSSIFSGFEDGWLYGTIECEQISTSEGGTIESESAEKFSIDRYGIHEVALNGEKAENPVLFGENADVEWQMLGNRKNLGDVVRLKEIDVSLVDIPIIPLEERRYKAYLKIEPRDPE